MRSVHYDVWRRGGLAATHELLRDGHTSHRLTAAVRSGSVIRTRQGHYACPELSTAEIEASRVGGRLTGISGARHHRMWTPSSTMLDVTVHPDARALRSRTDKTVRLASVKSAGVRVRWSDHDVVGTRTVAHPLVCLRDVVRTQPPIVAFAVVESALFHGIVSMAAWRRELGFLPRRHLSVLAEAGRNSESGGESLLKYHLIADSILFAQQVTVAGVGRVDFLLGDRLVVEVDGAEFHATRASFEEDRRRDAVLSALGYRVLRFSYTQIERDWNQAGAAIRASLARGDHLS